MIAALEADGIQFNRESGAGEKPWLGVLQGMEVLTLAGRSPTSVRQILMDPKR